MNKHTLIILLGSLGLLSAINLAHANPVVYGKANVSLNKHDAEDITGTTEDRWKLNSNASRLGVKGEKALDDTELSAVYQMEYEVALDDGTAQSTDIDADCDDDDTTTGETCASVSSTFKQRNIYVGLKGQFGQVIAGKHDTPLKSSQGKLDRFNDLPLGDLKNVLDGENRESNMLMYSSPEAKGFTGKLALIPGEGTAAAGNNGVADGISGSIKYAMDSFWVALASDSEVDGRDENRLSAEYDFGATRLGAIFQSGEDVVTGLESTGYLVSAQHKINKWLLKGQYTQRTDDAAVEVDTSMFTFGGDYKVSSKVKFYAYLSQWETDTADEEQSTFGLGTEVKF